ncbi:4Fe-4S dicluster domain-containing protein [Methylobacterium nonmethylotrophicum]|uniref:4Fe-4S dicluster domain-containing protein n=1 Tax=Methylobacterium nonmethylotrophicum TaxID=1141884 RepID=A0A4Z0NGS3_9HYPH|nr:4Fe-4S dicluster domain-containing protein [Methylobacterium nonmethylotrophicum]TGD94839.1 4Fe-4S dicluster domain-containing protein [Methylobacterium nonmethylotrophicum]
MPPLTALDRREALRLLGAGIALAAGGCSRPDEEILPYVRQPEQLLPGVPARYATALPLSGWARGVHAIAVDGRPIKIEGNPLHPGSRGATDVFLEAAILDLYDPDRSRAPRERIAGIGSWEAFGKAYARPLSEARARAGAGFRLLTGRITSPTLLRQIAALREAMPEAAWHVHEPLDAANARAGAALAFGRPLRALPRLDRAEIVVCLKADPLGPGPDQIRLSGALMERRRDPSRFGRLFVAESLPTLTGIKADERCALPPAATSALLAHLANGFGAGLPDPGLPEAARRFAEQILTDLRAHHGRAVVLVGEALEPPFHALAHWLNARLAAPVDWIEPPDALPGHAPGDLAGLARDIAAGEVSCVAILGTNPVQTAPADLGFSDLLRRVPFSVQAGTHADETAGGTHWHLPLAHDLEAWSDLRATDGTASLVQPLVRPLYGGRSVHEVLNLLTGAEARRGYDIVRETWQNHPRPDGSGFEGWWRRCLHDGTIPQSAAAPVTVPDPALPALPPAPAPCDLALLLTPDPALWDGRFANNAWLQECPHPVTKQVWGNALLLSHGEAARRGVKDGQTVSLTVHGTSLIAPVAVVSGVADGVAGLSLGHGRARAGQIGNAVGVDGYRLTRGGAARLIRDVTLTALDGRREILRTQNYTQIEGETEKLFPRIDLAALASAEPKGNGSDQPTLLEPWTGDSDGHAWGMVIDTAACIGCNACVIACQSENNVPVVGPEEIARGRMMHWLRVDIYDAGKPERIEAGFQPVPCMHCEHAPCEPVCPVAASVHDGEGLNLQVYNRCVGTRFCEANCPYKVRRFNFFGYADGQEYASLGAAPVRAQRNPNVTVRARGVMEKCTYCVQRIAIERQAAERDGRPMGEVSTACQSACPTRAIRFGDLNAKGSPVAAQRQDRRHYALMEELNTRPRTTYLADLRNPVREDRT